MTHEAPPEEATLGAKAAQDRPKRELMPDRILMNFVMMANDETRLRAGITLTVGGVLVTGTLIGVVEYVDLLRDQVVENVPAKNRKGWENLFTAWREVIALGVADEDAPDPEFIHLADARHVIPGAAPIPSGDPTSCWRGRLADVDGWSLGELRVS